MDDLNLEASRASWVQANFITDDTEALAAAANNRASAYASQLAKDAVRFDTVELPGDSRRKMNLLKLGLTLAVPADEKESKEVTRLEGALVNGKHSPSLTTLKRYASAVNHRLEIHLIAE